MDPTILSSTTISTAVPLIALGVLAGVWLTVRDPRTRSLASAATIIIALVILLAWRWRNGQPPDYIAAAVALLLLVLFIRRYRSGGPQGGLGLIVLRSG